MSTVVWVVRARVRDSRGALAAVALVTALASAFVLTAITGARRIESAWPRLLARTNAPQALVMVPVDGIAATVDQLQARDDVVAAGAFTWMPAAPAGLDSDDIGTWAGIGPEFGDTVFRPLIIRGREANPDRAGEVTVNEPLAELAHLEVGDHVRYVGPSGIDQPVEIVGIHRSPLEIGPNGGSPSSAATPAFMDRWYADVADLFGDGLRTPIAVRFRPGVDVSSSLDEIAAADPELGIVGEEAISSGISQGTSAQSTAYWLLAGASGIASLAAIGLLLSRLARSSAASEEVLEILGAPTRQRALATWATAAAGLVPGLLLGVALVPIASPLVRTGFAKVADPTTGGWVDGGALARSVLALVVVLLAEAGVLAARASSRSRLRPRVHPTSSARTRGRPTTAVGLALALGRQASPARQGARSTQTGLALVATAVIGTVVWVASLDRITTTPRLHGWDFDAYLYTVPDAPPETPSAMRAALMSDTDVVGLTHYQRTTIPLGGSDIDLFALSSERGSAHPTMRSGRPASGPGEITLGAQVVRRLDIQVGDTIRAPGRNTEVELRIVGLATFPEIGNADFDEAGAVTDETLELLDVPPLESGYLLDLAPGIDRHAFVVRLQEQLGSSVSIREPFLPASLTVLSGARTTVLALTGFLLALLATVYTFGAMGSMRQQRREVAIARTLGFTPRQSLESLSWHAIVAVAITAVVGLPLGTAIGRVAWRLSTRDEAVLDAFRLPVPTLLIGFGLGGLALLAIAVAVARRYVTAAISTELGRT